jgi:hypothetical protein
MVRAVTEKVYRDFSAGVGDLVRRAVTFVFYPSSGVY